jgi:hypothetical protein
VKSPNGACCESRAVCRPALNTERICGARQGAQSCCTLDRRLFCCDLTVNLLILLTTYNGCLLFFTEIQHYLQFFSIFVTAEDGVNRCVVQHCNARVL